jgi:hypothetical protein
MNHNEICAHCATCHYCDALKEHHNQITMNHNEIREEFKKKFCWQDTDGSWLLNASPLTVPDLLDYFIPKILLSYNAGIEKSIEVVESKKEYVPTEYEFDEITEYKKSESNESWVKYINETSRKMAKNEVVSDVSSQLKALIK